MDTRTTGSNPSLTWLGRLLRTSRFILVAATTFAAIWIGLQLVNAGGSLSVPATLAEPVEIRLDDGRYLGVDATGHIGTFGDFPDQGRENDSIGSTASVALNLNVQRDDRVSRAVLIVGLIAWLTAAWVGLVALSRIVTSTVAGEPFHADNPARLRVLGIAILSVPAVSFVVKLVINSTIKADVDVHVPFGEPWLMPLLVGLACFALAEVFAEAARLKEFEEATI